jgi:penicillin-binding protein 2
MFRDDRPPAPAQFSLRVAVLGGVALVIFAVIFFRLWYLGVLSGDRYLTEAENNQIREINVQAPRGQIVDRDGEVLVDNRTALELQVREDELPPSRSAQQRVFERLSKVIGMSPAQIEKEIKRQTKEVPASPVTLKRDVSYDLVYFLRENQSEFPGVSVDRVYVRRYPQGSLAAHLFGYVREITAEQLAEPRYQGLDPGDEVGQTGVEYTYDSLLRGINGATRVKVDASGSPTGGQLSVREPQAGNDLRLSLDTEVQEAGEAAVSSFGNPGGFVAMDVQSGEILALGSQPSFDPSIFGKPVVPESTYAQLTDPDNGNALANRAIQGLYPTGSTFKLITATAALEDGLITPTEIVNDTGEVRIGGVTFKNAGDAVNGPIDLRQALKVSSDVYFYLLGLEADGRGGEVIQEWARKLGLGETTGIDLPSEQAGLVPTPEWRNELFRLGQTDRPWTVGDAINLSVGQGDLQANPLQMAVAYATVANGGDVVRPHVGLSVEDPEGRVIQEVDPAPRAQVEISPETSDAILEGLQAAAMEPGGTSYPVFGGFPFDVAGKTGTAERGTGVEDQSWYVALAPYPNPEIVVALTIERGGFGADAAAPAVARMLEAYKNVKPGEVEAVENAASTEVYE